MSNIWLLLICILCIKDSSADSGFDYCNLDCPDTHIVCIRNNQCGLSSQCESEARAMPMTESTRHYLIHRHNYQRSKVAMGSETRDNVKTAANMHIISYSKNLEYVAECFLNSCSNELFDDCPTTEDFPDRVLQNVFEIDSPDPNYDFDGEEFFYTIVDTWYNQLADFTKTTVDNFPGETVEGGKPIGMAAQVLWGTTTHIGCARVRRASAVGGIKVRVACNYGPGGNIKGEAIYQRGPPCSKCRHEVCNQDYPGLCGKISSNSQSSGERFGIAHWLLFGFALIYSLK